MEYPLYSGFLYNLMQEKNNEEIGNVQLKMKQKVMDRVEGIIRPFIDSGQFRDDISVKDMSYLVVQVQWGMYDYLEMKYGLSFRENVNWANLYFKSLNNRSMMIFAHLQNLYKQEY